MTDLPNVVRERLKAMPAGPHPDPDLLTAFAEQALPDRERTSLLDHLARCSECRDVVALCAPTPSVVLADKDTARPRNAPWFAWPTLRWGALAACVVIVGTALLMQRTAKVPSAAVETDASLKEAPLREVVPANEIAEPARLDQNKARKTDEEVARKLATTRDAASATKQSAAGPSIVANAPKALDDKAIAWNAASKRADAGAGSFAFRAPAPAPRPAEQKLAQAQDAIEGVTSSAPAAANATPALEVSAGAVPAAPPIQKDEALGKAKVSSAGQVGTVTINAPAFVSNEKALPTAEARENLRAELYRHHADISRWTISSDGQLQHSLDSGKTWQPVAVADKATFRALSANGPDLWVGGADGLLYHSTDSGGHWILVKPTCEGATLSASIAAIEFADLQHGKLTTATGEIWLTIDAGQSWEKQR